MLGFKAADVYALEFAEAGTTSAPTTSIATSGATIC
jgi:hypothetical protein